MNGTTRAARLKPDPYGACIGRAVDYLLIVHAKHSDDGYNPGVSNVLHAVNLLIEGARISQDHLNPPETSEEAAVREKEILKEFADAARAALMPPIH